MQQRFHIVRDAYVNQSYGPRALQFLTDLVENVVDKKGIIENVIFDFGAVLVQWNQHFLYDKYFENNEEGVLSQVQAKSKANYFLNNICTPEWAARIDKGESFDCCVEELVLKYPKWKPAIEAYRNRWFDMLPSEIDGMADVVNSFKKKGYKVYGLSNWSAETFDEATKRFPVLNEIPERVISGEVGMVKPNKDIYYYLFNKCKIDPHTSLFIDDNLENIKTAKELGMYTIQFTTVEDLMKNDLIQALLCLKDNHTPNC